MELDEYKEIIQRFHRAIMKNDVHALAGMMSEHSGVNIERAEKPAFPLSDDISVDGMEVEGNGQIISVFYTQRVAGHKYPMVVHLRQSGDSLRITHSLPKLRR